MNVTQYKDGSKSVKTFSLSELVDTMKDRASGRAVEEFREKLEKLLEERDGEAKEDWTDDPDNLDV